LNPAVEPSQDAAMARLTRKKLPNHSVRVTHREAPRFTMTFYPGGHDALVPIGLAADETAAALQRAAIAFFHED
jgi:hypothetical protein